LRSQIKLGRIAGIEIGLHYSWFIIALLIVLSLADEFHNVTPHWSEVAVWAAAIATGILFFVTLLLHELAHSIVAKARGLKVRAITLFALGGVSQIESEAPNAKSEFWIAIAGPLTSVVLGLLFLGLARLAGWTPGSEPSSPVPAVLLWLGYINLILAAFNMIPGYPLDGGRVLRSIIWWITHSMERATRWASYVGQAVAFLFIVRGIWQFFFRHAGFSGLWIAFIGWFLLDAARSSYVQTEIMSALRGRRVADLMERDCATVEGHISVHDFVEQYLLHTGRRCFIVVQGGYLVGLITPADVRAVERERWAQTSVQSVMRPLRELRTVSPDTPATDALELMSRNDINQLPVVSNGHLEGLFSRAQILNFLRAHSELHGRA
jgi:Zn-dependent protease/predicted transcriptional regulator